MLTTVLELVGLAAFVAAAALVAPALAVAVFGAACIVLSVAIERSK